MEKTETIEKIAFFEGCTDDDVLDFAFDVFLFGPKWAVKIKNSSPKRKREKIGEDKGVKPSPQKVETKKITPALIEKEKVKKEVPSQEKKEENSSVPKSPSSKPKKEASQREEKVKLGSSAGRSTALLVPPEEVKVEKVEKDKTSTYDSGEHEIKEEYYEKFAEGIKHDQHITEGKTEESISPSQEEVKDHEWLEVAYVDVSEGEDPLKGVTPWVEEEKSEDKSGLGTLTADDWMDIMAGKSAPTTPLEESKKPEVTGPHLKIEIDYHAHHIVPTRKAPRPPIEKVKPVKEGLKKREEFEEVKLAYKKRFTASVKNPGRLCSVCGAREKANKCVICGEDGATIMTRLCEKCASDKKIAFSCLKCGKPNSRVIAKLCENCAPTYSGVCIKCGESLFK